MSKARPRAVTFRNIPALVCLAAGFALCAGSFDAPSRPSSEALRAHVRYLASDALTGRGVDTPGIKLARDHIAREFARYGLRPGGNHGSYFQAFDVVTAAAPKESSRLRLDGRALELHRDWTPLGVSGSGDVEAGLVFAGYGITAPEHGYDDYRGIDATGKIVLVLRYEPPPRGADSPFRGPPRYSRHATLRAKVDNARARGASGLLLVDVSEKGDELIRFEPGPWRENERIVAAQVRREVAESWFQSRAISLAELKGRIDRDHEPASLALPDATAALTIEFDEIRTPADNVVGILPGADPRSSEEAIVVGAHYDHLGFGRFGARDSSQRGRLHYGADDNASGTAVLLEAARLLSHGPRPPRTTVFVAFSAEELGLHGSRRYAAHPPLPIWSTVAMINLDMVGRLRDNRLIVYGARSSPALTASLREAAGPLNLELVERNSVGRSDHLIFYLRRVPVAHLMTGLHDDYHRPSDTWDKLNVEGMARIAALVAATVETLGKARNGLEFVDLGPPRGPPAAGDPGTGPEGASN